ncbi:hypothetical protein Nepgr_025234 [Nepenthes gracilis]|uniref:RING-type domain-containing protein n=1 Tax=Nepenthes gracilis TaxID=150966 RepID=A0AAD3T7G1_NEPGR|nr:hypothetical protein Nepgr_025234 [Nepenthes gracilis]
MGSVCCVASRDRKLPERSSGEGFHRNATQSPSWSFQWDNRRCVADEIDYPSHQPCERISKDVVTEMKGTLGSDDGTISTAESPMEDFVTSPSQKSPTHEGVGLHSIANSDPSTASRYFPEEKTSAESPEISAAVPTKLAFSTCSNSSISQPTTDPFCSHCQLSPATTIPSRLIRHSPGHQLFRQVSDSQIQGLKSPNNTSLSDGQPSFVFSAISNELTTGSQGGSSDSWSLRTFSELVAFSQRERWSFDSGHFGSGRSKISGSSSRFSSSLSSDLQTCGACSRPLAERVSVSGHELSVAAVLVCGHIYHAECLETVTPDADKYDPVCPVCLVGERQVSKMSRKALKAEAELKMKFHKISKNRVMDSYFDGNFNISEHKKTSAGEGKSIQTEASSSSRISLGKKPFLRRHFSLRSKWLRSSSESESSGKIGFWARYRPS